MPLRVSSVPSESVLCKACPVCSLDAPDHLPPSTLCAPFFRTRPIAVFGQDAKAEDRNVQVPESAEDGTGRLMRGRRGHQVLESASSAPCHRP
eukprot:2677930-Alexandrium_andersonii.AAC.1